ncbi:MAG: hypothetical protein JNK23_13015 [Opitutaceae bacterium]|nr:hypothetical protein [Opitutaceae bacterium]
MLAVIPREPRDRNMRLTSSNISKPQRARRASKPEFAGTGIVAGLFVGWLVALLAEVVLGKPKMIIMLLGGFGGMLLGAACETVRYFWRLRGYRAARSP